MNLGPSDVRFPHPLPSGTRIRARFTAKTVKALPPSKGRRGLHMVTTAVIEAEGIEKPVCVADLVTRRYE